VAVLHTALFVVCDWSRKSSKLKAVFSTNHKLPTLLEIHANAAQKRLKKTAVKLVRKPKLRGFLASQWISDNYNKTVDRFITHSHKYRHYWFLILQTKKCKANRGPFQLPTKF